ncbi:hypothetical protein Slala03_75630 [Streptomyces lavendulae subsp. lavendulae]|uniref:hypothetical protein n=1 Tax=Streptomyces lavendulae TaxID=1914 RepID=UPI0024A51EF7|nr:hypothetical protein [Streptomyces lavendulae]GLV87874.1 hypothetical protein Slala03_75630 [Streptomyces lavendulae subsp. lavendulae]
MPITRAAEELRTVDWALLRHGVKAEATDVPRWILALHGDDEERAEGAVLGLWVLTRRNETYPATVAAIPFLVHAAVHVPRHRAGLVGTLVSMADLGGAEEDRMVCRYLVTAVNRRRLPDSVDFTDLSWYMHTLVPPLLTVGLKSYEAREIGH